MASKEKGFIWYAVRYSFVALIVSIIFGGIVLLLVMQRAEPLWLLVLIYLASFLIVVVPIFNLIVSIIHLTKYEEKALAIIGIIISALIFIFVSSNVILFAILAGISGILNFPI